jgi:hypothetical protein
MKKILSLLVLMVLTATAATLPDNGVGLVAGWSAKYPTPAIATMIATATGRSVCVRVDAVLEPGRSA